MPGTWTIETLRLYASIFAKPRRDYANGPLHPPHDADLAAAEALRFMADELERKGDDNEQSQQ